MGADHLRLTGVLASLACTACLVTSGCGDEPEPVRVGVLVECTGLLASSGEPALAAAELPFLERGGALQGSGPEDGIAGASVAGRPVEIVRGCTEFSQLSLLIAETRRLIEAEGVEVVIGPTAPPGGVVMRRIAERYPETTFLLGATSAQEATLEDPQPNVYRFGADDVQSAAGLGTYAFRDLGWRRAAIAFDYSQGSWERAAGFAAEFCALGGEVVARGSLDPAAPDWASPRRLADESDGVALFSSGVASPAEFLFGYSRYAAPLRERLVVSGFGFSLTGALSPGGIDLRGVVLGGDIPLESERPAWRRYVRSYEQAFPSVPRSFAQGVLVVPYYVAAEALARALEQADGDIDDGGDRLRAELAKVSFNGPAGPVHLDRHRQAVVTVHLRRISGRGAELGTEPFRLVRNVEQTFGGSFSPSTPPPSPQGSPRCEHGSPPAWATQRLSG
jgi:branched-chain amino acid transport system substrate-binding protein